MVTDTGEDVVVDPVSGGVTRFDRFVTGGNLVALTHRPNANPTALVGYNYLANQLVTVNPAAGTVTNIVASGITASPRDSVGLVADATSNTAFLVSQVAAGPRFIAVNLATNTVSAPRSRPHPGCGHASQGHRPPSGERRDPVSGHVFRPGIHRQRPDRGQPHRRDDPRGGHGPHRNDQWHGRGRHRLSDGEHGCHHFPRVPSFTVNVPLLNTTQSSPDKTFTVTLTQAAGSTVVPAAPNNSPVTILAHNPDLYPPRPSCPQLQPSRVGGGIGICRDSC